MTKPFRVTKVLITGRASTRSRRLNKSFKKEVAMLQGVKLEDLKEERSGEVWGKVYCCRALGEDPL